jgi:hypothetical protein
MSEREGVELTEGERDALGDWWDGVWDESRPLAGLAPVVEAILAARLAPVLALHGPVSGSPFTVCAHDGMAWPCPTAAALRASPTAPRSRPDDSCNCAQHGSAARCALHTQADFDASKNAGLEPLTGVRTPGILET